MGSLPPHINAGGGQMYQQQIHQGMQLGMSSHPSYQSQQHFSENPPYKDGNAAGSMACLYQNYQVVF